MERKKHSRQRGFGQLGQKKEREKEGQGESLEGKSEHMKDSALTNDHV